jgi:hypothetical protein
MAYPEQPSYIRIGSDWKVVEQAFVYKSSAWKRVNQAYLYQGGQWKRVYAYDSIAPTIVRFALTDTVSGQTYGSSKTTASYVLEFSEEIAGWTNGMITISSNPGTAWEIASVTTSDNISYAVEIEKPGTQTSGTVTLSVNPAGITDESEINAWAGAATPSQSFSIDVTRPAVSEFASASAGASRTVTFSLRFSEEVTGLIQSEFTIGGTSTGWRISSFSGSGSLYTIVLTETSLGSTTNGTLTLSIPQNSVVDAIGNTGPSATATSSTFNVARTPVTPTVSAVSSTDLTLHNRRVNYTVSVPAGLTTISHVVGYLYDSNDNYTGTSQTIDVTDTQSAFITSGSFDVGRNPGTKYYVRARTLNTASLYSEYSLRQEITTGGDKTPPVLAAPTVTANTPADPGVNTTVVRSLSYSFASPSSYLTSEVAKVNIYCIRVEDGAQVGTTEVLVGAGWGAAAITGTFGSLAASKDYYIYARSTDIYGGTNSMANSDSTTKPTTAIVTVQTGSLTYDWGAESAAFTEDTEANKHIISGNTYRSTDAFVVPGWRAGDPGPYVGTETYKVTDVKVFAKVVVSGINITSDKRSFIVEWSGARESFASVNLTSPYYDGEQAPFSNNSGTLERSESAGFTLGYDNGRGGRLRFKGAGTIVTVQTSPSDERIRVRCEITMRKKTWTATDTRGSYSY